MIVICIPIAYEISCVPMGCRVGLDLYPTAPVALAITRSPGAHLGPRTPQGPIAARSILAPVDCLAVRATQRGAGDRSLQSTTHAIGMQAYRPAQRSSPSNQPSAAWARSIT